MGNKKFEIVIIGGGLAGLVAANLLAKKERNVLLIEKKTYPFHRVCGEYISNEALEFLQNEHLLPSQLDLPQISNFLFSDTQGKETQLPLDMGGFGISRYELDAYMYEQAKQKGAEMLTGTQVEDLSYDGEEEFTLTLSAHRQVKAKYVIGAFGKRSKLDKVMDRDFMKKRSPYLGVKYHIRTDFNRETVALHNFEGGYCGINAIEDGKYNLCYLGSRDQLREMSSIPAMEEKYLWANPILKRIFQGSDFLFEKPEVINEINFDPKSPVEDHVLMAGDAAGLITPLCGNGMAIAIQSGKFAAEVILAGGSREVIESSYRQSWEKLFKQRLWVGRKVQKLFGSGQTSTFARRLIHYVPFAAKQIVKNTHGKSF